jgi:hypothetical protein
MKRILTLSFLSLAVITVYHLYDESNSKQPKQTVVVKNQPNDLHHEPAPKKETVKAKPANNPSTANLPTPFYAVNRLSDEAKSVLTEAGVLTGDLNNEAYIEFDLPALRKLENGDNFELMIPQTSETFIAEVTFVDTASNGDKSIFGNVTGADGRFHTTVITVGKNAIYGQFTAPSGNYVFESKDQYGWIAAKRDLYRKHVEFEHSEFSHHSDAKHAEQQKTDIFAPKLNKNDK